MIVDKPTFKVTNAIKSVGKWKTRPIGIPSTSMGALGLGNYLAIGPMKPREIEAASNQFCKINYTTPPGGCSDLMYKFTFQIPKWGYGISKIDEWIEVSPTHREYYDRTVAMKDQLAGQIKQGLAHAANAVSDFELVNHDLRKYKEIMTYFNEKSEHSLKAMFIDQVDVHNGNMSMVQMVQRWSTLILDFQNLTDKDITFDGIAKKLNVPKAEAVVLKTKNLLYMQWKNLFKTAAIQRYERMMTLAKAREKSIDEYREWLKPYIVRFARLRAGHGIESERHKMLRSYIDLTGHVTFTNFTRFWIWKYFKPIEMRRAGREKNLPGKWVVEPYDAFTRENFVINPTQGLAAIYPWLLDPYDPKDPLSDVKYPNKFYADYLINEIKGAIERGEMAPAFRSYYMYYLFVDIKIPRSGIRTANGEQEDMNFEMQNWMFSQNIMLVKLLEMRCREIELNRYIDALLGINIAGKSASQIARKEFPNVYGVKEEVKPTGIIPEILQKVKASNEWFRNQGQKITKPRVPGKFMFFKPGPYEFDFGNRINKGYLVPMGRHYHGVIEGFLKKQMGVY